MTEIINRSHHRQYPCRIKSSTIIGLAILITAKTAVCSASFADDVLVTSPSVPTSSSTPVTFLDSRSFDKYEKNDISSSQEAFVEIEGHTIGDEHRSETSSKQFFNFIDKDRDGKLGQSELSQFLKDHIGGLSLDEDKETELEAASIMDRLDHNKDDELDSKDVFRYWKSLDSLLTVDEVAEWVVHSVQLPPEIGEIFRKNHVTGYDFPELVDNDGKALLEELQIEKPTFRKKIVRLVNARMLGIGKRPAEPVGIQIILEDCHTAVITWKKMESEGFPVHKFRVQRRRLNRDSDKRIDKTVLYNGCVAGKSSCAKNSDFSRAQDNVDMHNDFNRVLSNDLKDTESENKGSCPSADLGSGNCEKMLTPSQRNLLEWEDVYDQSLSGFHDFGLERGQRGYQYRIQAWNAVGKSEWVLFEIKQWGRKKCDRIANRDTGRSLSRSSSFVHSFSWLYYVWKFVYSCVNVVMGLIGLFVAVLKCKRAMQVSTASRIDPLFPWVLRVVNTLMKAMLGIDVIPQGTNGIGNTTQATTENHPYDVSVNSVGLFGYKESSDFRHPGQTPLPPLSRKVKTNGSSHISEQKVLSESNKINRNQPTVSFMRLKGKRAVANADVLSESAPERRLQRDQSSVTCGLCSDGEDNNVIQHDNVYPVHEEADGINHASSRSVRPAMFSPDSNSAIHKHDDNHCNTCKKKFKFGKRKRHHCSICFGSFCHKHGRTTHSNLVTCKVPGNCVCNQCLQKATAEST